MDVYCCGCDVFQILQIVIVMNYLPLNYLGRTKCIVIVQFNCESATKFSSYPLPQNCQNHLLSLYVIYAIVRTCLVQFRRLRDIPFVRAKCILGYFYFCMFLLINYVNRTLVKTETWMTWWYMMCELSSFILLL